MSTVAPASATSTVPVIVWVGASSSAPALVIATVGATGGSLSGVVIGLPLVTQRVQLSAASCWMVSVKLIASEPLYAVFQGLWIVSAPVEALTPVTMYMWSPTR